MSEKEYILKLMYIAFLEIRMASHAKDSSTCFILSDVFHNVPLQMIQADQGKKDYADIVVWIRQKCEERNCTSWLENAINNIAGLP